MLKYKRNLITKLEENSEEEKCDEPGTSSIVDATIAEIDVDDNTTVEKDVESEVEIEFEKADEDQITSSSKDDEDDGTSAKESGLDSESEVNAAPSLHEESESEGEIKSEGEASDTLSDSTATEMSDGPTDNKGSAKMKSMCTLLPLVHLLIKNYLQAKIKRKSTKKTKSQRQMTKCLRVRLTATLKWCRITGNAPLTTTQTRTANTGVTPG